MRSQPETAQGPDRWPIPIGVAAQRSGVSAKMVRYYESLGLLSAVARTDSGYRQYGETELRQLRFIRRARDLGFSIEEITELLSLWSDQGRTSASVKQIAQQHMEALSSRIASLQAMQRSLQQLLHHCHGDKEPDCPILDALAGEPEPSSGISVAPAALNPEVTPARARGPQH
jgi:MerR family copper efflux transcriptional regulator